VDIVRLGTHSAMAVTAIPANKIRYRHRGPRRVKLRRTQYEQMSSGLPPKADIA
jgi:hypothetical protein